MRISITSCATFVSGFVKLSFQVSSRQFDMAVNGKIHIQDLAPSNWGKHLVLKTKRCTLERVEKFISKIYFSDINLYSRLYPKTFCLSELLHCAVDGRVKYKDAITGTFSPVKVGDSFGPSWSTHWFKVTARIPDNWLNEEIRFRWNSNSEAMVWKDGKPIQGLSGEERTDYILTKNSIPKTCYSFYVEMACNGLFGTGDGGLINPPSSTQNFKLSMAEIAVFDRDCYQVIIDLTTLIGMAKHLPEENLRGAQALFVANDIVNMCEVTNRESYKRCHEHAKTFLSQKNGEGQHVIHAMGHCHIDTAWLWPYAETIRKCGRSWSSAIGLMKLYPEFTFTCSQAQQFEWVKLHYPTLFEDIKTFVKKGNFIPVGGTWVEMDGNIPSGESIVRQFLYGQNFFKTEFGSYCQEFWLPDTFGYTAQLPQIMVGCGIKYFVTQKLSWSLINKFPHNSFIWKGIDGSRCLAHFPPGDTYESMGGVDDIVKTVKNLKDKGRTNVSMLLYGYGDGGGGPTEDMIEKLQRVQDTDGLPRIVSSSPRSFFKSLDENNSSNLCTWVGELYLELHQGTFTAQAKIKNGNRRGEFLLRDVEFLSSIAFGLNKTASNEGPFTYPEEELKRLWKLLLLNQFHDVLPGSCINDVVSDALKYYADINESASKLVHQATSAIINQLPLNNSLAKYQLIAFNTFCWPRREVISLKTALLNQTDSSVNCITQSVSSDETLVLVDIPSMGFVNLFNHNPGAYEHCCIEILQDLDIVLLKNKYLTAKLDRTGRVVSLIHNGGKRDAIPPGCYGNQFVLFDNMPLYWDAWDVMPYHLETRNELIENKEDCRLKIVEKGPLRVSAKFSLKISEESWLVQEISLDAVSPFLSFHTQVEWRENRKFLKVEFPVNVCSTNATYEIQFGHLQRPTHFNTSWDWARYEVCAQKWFNLSEHNWGCSVMNNNKYGCSTQENVMRISLLRSPKAPDADADMGFHEIKYAIFPHIGTFQDSGIIQYSYNFNNKISVTRTNFFNVETTSFFQVTNSAIVLETVKKAVDDPNDLVLRAYEAFGGHNSTRIISTFKIRKCFRCDLLEQIQGEELKWQNGGVALDFKPFEIITLTCIF